MIRPLVPQTIGRYSVHSELASGGMATVYLARLLGPSGFARTVAVKRPHPHLTVDPEFSLMFIDEARLAARISHPNVVSTLDIVQTPDELALVMDYVHGEALSKLTKQAHLRDEHIPASIAAAIMIDALHGLHAAHEATDSQGNPLGIVHRDVSPQNLLVGVDGITRIVDFGIAKAAGASHKTRSGTVKGKSAYMAPEQLDGKAVSRLADIFAASIVLWELLTGERLFLGQNDVESLHNCLVRVIPPPSSIVPGLPATFDEILCRGLARDPAHRYPTAREMALEIENCIEAVRPSMVGAWVSRLAGDALAERAKRVAEMEGAPSTNIARTGKPSLSSAPSAPVSSLTGVTASGDLSSVVRRAQHSTRSVPIPIADTSDLRTESSKRDVFTGSAHRSLNQTGSPRRLTWRVSALLLFLLTIGAASLRWGVYLPADPTERAVAVASDARVIEALATSPTVEDIAPTPSNLPVVPSSSVSTVATQPSSNVRGPSMARPPPVRVAKPVDNCIPPYSIDSLGREIFKPECLP
jgi:eukaryotic-like serine/threonine-protein kinase